jgi:hypothetical protein
MTRIALCTCVVVLCSLSSVARAVEPAPGPTPLRLGVSVNGGVGFFYPSSANDFVQYALDSRVDTLGSLLGSVPDLNPVPLLVNVPVQILAFARVSESFQAEVWWETGTGNGSGWTLDESYSYGYEWATFHEKVVFTPSWRALGANALYIAGGPHGRVHPMFGAGLGYYTGTFLAEYSGSTSTGTTWNTESRYEGKGVGGNAIVGISFAVARNFELGLRVTGRYANIPELKRDGVALRNPDQGNEDVALNLSGIDFRLGASIVLP